MIITLISLIGLATSRTIDWNFDLYHYYNMVRAKIFFTDLNLF